ncbi:hypothetical protein BLNAU_4388 [Blattamonas nauphoetae]|uniref:Uncharacterized protein n=1 Tax=Blattamonas nauphoetae TaxID=2049346 RepID=A0ABQ9YAD2_9EUKA|nr:hypothetical protein BLNAU_4388 [Blattamonas nauphoetae]
MPRPHERKRREHRSRPRKLRHTSPSDAESDESSRSTQSDSSSSYRVSAEDYDAKNDVQFQIYEDLLQRAEAKEVSLNTTISSLMAELKRSENELAEIQDENQKLQADINHLANENAAMKEELHLKNQEQSKNQKQTQKQISDANLNLQREVEEKDRIVEENRRLGLDIQECRDILNSITFIPDNRESYNMTKKTSRQRYTQSLVNQQAEVSLASKISQFVSRFESMHQELVAKDVTINENEGTIEELQKQVAHEQKQLEDTKQEIQKLDTQLSQSQTLIQNLRKENELTDEVFAFVDFANERADDIDHISDKLQNTIVLIDRFASIDGVLLEGDQRTKRKDRRKDSSRTPGRGTNRTYLARKRREDDIQQLLEEKRKEMTSNLDCLEALVDEAEQRCEQLISEKKRMRKEELDKLKVSELRKHVEEEKERQKEVRAGVGEGREEALREKEKRVAIEADIRRLDEETEKMRTKIKKLKNEKEELAKRLQESESERKEVERTATRVQADLDEKMRETRQNEMEKKQLERQLDRAEMQIKTLSETLSIQSHQGVLGQTVNPQPYNITLTAPTPGGPQIYPAQQSFAQQPLGHSFVPGMNPFVGTIYPQFANPGFNATYGGIGHQPAENADSRNLSQGFTRLAESNTFESMRREVKKMEEDIQKKEKKLRKEEELRMTIEKQKVNLEEKMERLQRENDKLSRELDKREATQVQSTTPRRIETPIIVQSQHSEQDAWRKEEETRMRRKEEKWTIERARMEAELRDRDIRITELEFELDKTRRERDEFEREIEELNWELERKSEEQKRIQREKNGLERNWEEEEKELAEERARHDKEKRDLERLEMKRKMEDENRTREMRRLAEELRAKEEQIEEMEDERRFADQEKRRKEWESTKNSPTLNFSHRPEVSSPSPTTTRRWKEEERDYRKNQRDRKEKEKQQERKNREMKHRPRTVHSPQRVRFVDSHTPSQQEKRRETGRSQRSSEPTRFRSLSPPSAVKLTSPLQQPRDLQNRHSNDPYTSRQPSHNTRRERDDISDYQGQRTMSPSFIRNLSVEPQSGFMTQLSVSPLTVRSPRLHTERRNDEIERERTMEGREREGEGRSERRRSDRNAQDSRRPQESTFIQPLQDNTTLSLPFRSPIHQMSSSPKPQRSERRKGRERRSNDTVGVSMDASTGLFDLDD